MYLACTVSIKLCTLFELLNSQNTCTKSFSAWIKDWEDKLMIKITRRVELVSGLKAFQPKEAEDYQVHNSRQQKNEYKISVALYQ